jgi:nucleoside-diphosphate-sugar epimerase
MKKFFLFLKKKKNIKKIIFASSTSVFGNKTSVSNEKSSCNPISNYGRQKLNCEKFIMHKVKDKRFIIYRFPTIFGYSPRMRLDLTIHEFARYIYFNKKFEVFNLSSVRPYCDINDLSNILYQTIIVKKNFSSQIFCIGNEKYNFSKLDIINILKKIIKRKKYNYKITDKIDPDKRSYFVLYNNFKNLKIYNFNENPIKKFSNLLFKIKKIKTFNKKKLTSIWY